MYVAEDIGFEKLDILSQRGIGHIRESAEIIRANRQINVDVHQVGQFITSHGIEYGNGGTVRSRPAMPSGRWRHTTTLK